MRNFWLPLVVALTFSAAGGYARLAENRAHYWGAILSRDLAIAGSPPLQGVRAIPFKGCGWTLGETVWGWTRMADVRTKVLMCRNRQGVRLDVTTFESRWIR